MAEPVERETVVLVHGLLRSGLSLTPAAAALRAAGYAVSVPSFWNFNRDLETLAASLRSHLEQRGLAAGTDHRLHFLTHSLGGLIVRRFLQESEAQVGGRVVMLCPPNQGAARAGQVQRRLGLPWGRFDPLTLFDPQGPELQALEEETPAEVGVIAGGLGRERGWARGLDGDNDGTVRVVEMMLPGASVLQIPAHHSLVMYHPGVVRQAVHFLRHGRFDPLGAGTLLQAQGSPPAEEDAVGSGQ